MSSEHEYNDDSEFTDHEENSDEADGQSSTDDMADSVGIDLIRPELISKVVSTLSADAQRCDGKLKREDVNRAYLRKELSISECMAVENEILAAGYQITDTENSDDSEDEGAADPRPKHHYLSEEEERDCGRKIQLARLLPLDTSKLDSAYVARIRKEAEEAKELFLVTNIRYVEKLARKMGTYRHLSLEDIKQEGYLGLLRATDSYDPELGFRFKTYATWWIEQYMSRCIDNNERTIRIPVHAMERLSRIRRAESKFMLAYGHSPTTDELAIAVGMDTEKLMQLLWREEASDCAEGDAPIGEDTSLLSLIADPSETPFDLAVRQELQDRFTEVLAGLTQREEKILRMRFGIGMKSDHTLEEIGKQFGVTRERIRQIEAKALRKLRHPSRRVSLESFLDF